MKKKKGFTLIELLAVIIILGILLLIAVPAVNKYIDNSRKKTYVNSISTIVNAVSTSISSLEYPTPKKGEGIIIPFSEVELERGTNTKSPYGKYEEGKSYIVVAFDGVDYHYYVVALDEAGYAIPFVDKNDLSINSISNDVNKINNNICSISDIEVGCTTDQFRIKSKTNNENFTVISFEVLQLASRILFDNNEMSDSNIDFSKTSEETGTNGLYYTSTNTQDDKTTYYFRGDVDNNYVKMGTYTKNTCTYEGVEVAYFDHNTYTYDLTGEQCKMTKVCFVDEIDNYVVGLDEEGCKDWAGVDTGKYATYTSNPTKDRLWRIVRINEDGSIKIITQDIVGSSVYNNKEDDNAYIGYMYGATGQSGENAYNLTHANNNLSTIKTYLDEWYGTNLNSYSSKISNETGFCNDRSVASNEEEWYRRDTALGYGTNLTMYGAYNRLNNIKQPQFVCPNVKEDLFTLEKSGKGNEALTYPVGLLTADEITYAGGVYDKDNKSMYLTIGEIYWTMSPFNYNGDAFVYSVNFDGKLEEKWVTTTYENSDSGYYHYWYGVRPVVNLKSNVKVKDGEGTLTAPYVIE